MKIKTSLFAITLILSGNLQAAELKDDIRQALKENPDILFQVIRENPLEFMAVVQSAAQQAQKQAAIEKQRQEQRAFEAAFEQPLKPEIRKDETIRGTAGAPLVLVEYSDFQCPYCQRGSVTVKQLMKKYEGKIQFIYKHLPLDFHQAALPASRYYEALRLIDPELAFKFHDAIFQDNGKLKQGEAYLKQLAQQSGADMVVLEKTLKEKAEYIDARIQQDIAESKKFGMTGTPGFILNGIPLRGAYPIDRFEQVINELQKRKMAKL